LTVIQALIQEHEYIIIDELSHASIYDGCKLTGAKLLRFRHNDLASLEELLQQVPPEVTKLVVTEGVFSMDGDIGNLPGIFGLCRKHKAWLMVDEAHSLGTLGKTGRGIEEHFGLKNAVDIKMGTLKKTIPSIGGYVAGKKELIDYLRHVSRAYIFSTPLPPAQLAAAIESFKVIQDETWRIDKLHRNVDYTLQALQRRGFDTAHSQTGIIPILCGSNELAFSMALEAHKHKVYVLPVIAPAVPQGKARIRLVVTAAHELEELEYAMNVLAKAGKKIGIGV
jgi:7-keto-8-aminopelargonate synthetase-like enzyme